MSKDKKGLKRNIKMFANFVSLVDYGANHGGKDHFFMLKNADGIDMKVQRVPAIDASDEDKRTAQTERAKQYGIEALEDGANLSYPEGGPTTEALYGDPVSLTLPLGKDDNEKDSGKIKEALASFKDNHEVYSKDESKARVYERMVRAALSEDVEVSYDPDDSIDKLLPADLVQHLTKAGEPDGADGDGGEPSPEVDDPDKGDRDSQLAKVQSRLDNIKRMARLANLAKRESDSKPNDGKEQLAKSGVATAVTEVADAELAKRVEKAEAESVKLRDELKKQKAEIGQLRQGIGASIAIRPGATIDVSTKGGDNSESWEDDMGIKNPAETLLKTGL